jgi:hypothetical protein
MCNIVCYQSSRHCRARVPVTDFQWWQTSKMYIRTTLLLLLAAIAVVIFILQDILSPCFKYILNAKTSLAKKRGAKVVRINAGISKYTGRLVSLSMRTPLVKPILFCRGHNNFTYKKVKQDAHYSMLWAKFVLGKKAKTEFKTKFNRPRRSWHAS